MDRSNRHAIDSIINLDILVILPAGDTAREPFESCYNTHHQLEA